MGERYINEQQRETKAIHRYTRGLFDKSLRKSLLGKKISQPKMCSSPFQEVLFKGQFREFNDQQKDI